MKYLFIFLVCFSSTQACTQIAYIKQKKLIHLLKICIQNIIMTKRSSKNYFKILKKKKSYQNSLKSAPERKLTWNGCNIGEAQCINYKKLLLMKVIFRMVVNLLDKTINLSKMQQKSMVYQVKL